MHLPLSWKVLERETHQDYFLKLNDFVRGERDVARFFPAEEKVFAALQATPYESVRVLLLGQDPYHGEGQAHGLCFSVRPGVKLPPSLKNVYKELADDVGCAAPGHGYLMSWAHQGILMLNTVLTVRENEPNSHRSKGWEHFTDAIIRVVNAKADPVVFVLWGNNAQKKKTLIDVRRNAIVESAHPSPLSAHRGFFGSRPFSKVNAALSRFGLEEIVWQLPAVN